MILDAAALVLLTGKRRPSAQRRVLDALRIPYRPRPDGTLVVYAADLAGAQSAAREPRMRL